MNRGGIELSLKWENNSGMTSPCLFGHHSVDHVRFELDRVAKAGK